MQKLGKLTVIAGPMYSGKTGKLVAMVEVFTKMGHKVATVKPSIDKRYSNKQEIHSHDHKTSFALLIDPQDPNQMIKPILEQQASKVIIDEAQFFDKQKVKATIEALRQKGLHVIAAGLLFDYRREPFGAMPDLMGLADERLELFAICQKCGAIARHTERTGGGVAEIQVGAQDTYIASCEQCHTIWQTSP